MRSVKIKFLENNRIYGNIIYNLLDNVPPMHNYYTVRNLFSQYVELANYSLIDLQTDSITAFLTEDTC